MKLLLVCNNYGQKFDGIGAYALKVYENFNVDVYSDITRPENRIRRIISLGMSVAILKASFELMRGTSKRIIIEYPFVEWNPMICIAFLWLKIVTIMSKAELISSIHEFVRLNRLRRAVIILLTYLSDMVLVSERENIEALKVWNKNIYKFDIPSNIEFNSNHISKNRNQFVYFGMINKAKAFNEMMDAWDEFNKQKKFKLVILTASQLEDMQFHPNVEYIFNADDKVVETKLFESTFAIVPIKPHVDEKNATFKAGCLAGCISIGKFCNEYKQLKFIFDLESYDKDSFVACLKKCSSLREDDIRIMKEMAFDYSKNFTIKSARNKLKRILLMTNRR